MKVESVKTRLFVEGENLVMFIREHIRSITEKSVLVVTSKIAALSESRTAPARNGRAFTALVRRESDRAVRTKYVWLTMKDEMVMASSGIDASNANGRLILLPRDSYALATSVRRALCCAYGIRDLGVIVSDSMLVPLRSGVIGGALGYAGFQGVRDYRGKKDLFGRRFTFSQTNCADSLATAATFVMGEGSERQPLALITGAPVRFTSRAERGRLTIAPEDDIFAPLLKKWKSHRSKLKR